MRKAAEEDFNKTNKAWKEVEELKEKFNAKKEVNTK